MKLTIKNEAFEVDTQTKTVNYDNQEFKQVGDFDNRVFVNSNGEEVEKELGDKLNQALIVGYTVEKKQREKEHGGKEVRYGQDRFYVNTENRTIKHNDITYKAEGNLLDKRFVDSQNKEVTNDELKKQLSFALANTFKREKEAREKTHDGKEIKIKGEAYYVNTEKGTVKHNDQIYQRDSDSHKFLDADGKSLPKEVYENLQFAFNIANKDAREKEPEKEPEMVM